MKNVTYNHVNPYIRHAAPSVLTPNHKIGMRVIYDYELIYIERGSFDLTYAGVKHRVGAGSFLFLRPGISHSFRGIGEEVSQPHIHFDMIYDTDSSRVPISFADIDSFTPAQRKLIRKDMFEKYPKTPLVFFSDKESALSLFYEVTSKQGGVLTKKGKMTELIDMLISDNYNNCFDTDREEYDIAIQLKDYIDAGQGIYTSLEELAAQFSYSKYYLERRFRQKYGSSLIAYRNKVRMSFARQLLQNHTVTEAASRVGYSSIYAFSRAYKEHFGVYPSKDK